VTNWTALPTVWKQVSHGMQPFLSVGTAKGNKSATWKVWEPANKANALRARLCNISRKMFYKVVAKQTLCNVACYQREITKTFKDRICFGSDVLSQQQENTTSLNFQTKVCRREARVQFPSTRNTWNDTKITKRCCVYYSAFGKSLCT
jgi:hypothetical protein